MLEYPNSRNVVLPLAHVLQGLKKVIEGCSSLLSDILCYFLQRLHSVLLHVVTEISLP